VDVEPSANGIETTCALVVESFPLVRHYINPRASLRDRISVDTASASAGKRITRRSPRASTEHQPLTLVRFISNLAPVDLVFASSRRFNQYVCILGTGVVDGADRAMSVDIVVFLICAFGADRVSGVLGGSSGGAGGDQPGSESAKGAV